MTRRKQICPKRMKYDGKGDEVAEQSLEIHEAALADSDSPGVSPEPGSPVLDRIQMSEIPDKCPDRSMIPCDSGNLIQNENNNEPSTSPRQTVTAPSDQVRADAVNGIPKDLDDVDDGQKRPDSADLGRTTSVSKSDATLDSAAADDDKDLTLSLKFGRDPGECSPPHLTETGKEILRTNEGPPGGSKDKHDDGEETKDMPRLFPVADQCPSTSSSSSLLVEPSAPEREDPSSTNATSSAGHQDSGKVKDTFLPRLYPEHKTMRRGDGHERDRSHHHHDRDPHVRNHHRESDSRRKHHHGDSSYKYHHHHHTPEPDHFSATSLAKKYADLFSSPKSCSESSSRSKSGAVKEEKLASSPVCTSYEPLRGIADMVKAAEHRSPTATHSVYHSKYSYVKNTSGSPSSLDALHRIVDKDRSSTSARPSVVQNMNSVYHKYLPLATSGHHRDSNTPCTPDPDPDKPLDLSLKSKDKDEGGSSSSPSAAAGCSSRKKLDSASSSSGYEPYLSPHSDLPSSSSTSTSTLASLEKKFGEDSFMFERIGSKQFNTPIRQFYMSAFGMGIYSTALNNSYPFPASHPMSTVVSASQSQTLQANSGGSGAGGRCSRNESPLRKSTASAGSATHGEDSTKSYAPSKFLEQAMKESKSGDVKKHTNLQCSCGADFETLYQLTLHLQETGHPANNTKNGTHHDYPKLVRGQDMWLNHGSEQTKQILRCMQCGESFKSLPELTVHMIQTKHYTNIVGAEPQTGSKLAKQQHQQQAATSTSAKWSMSTSDCSETEYQHQHRCDQCNETFDDAECLSKHQEKTGHITPKREPATSPLPKAELTTPSRPTSAQSDKDTTGSGMTHSSNSSATGSVMHFKRRLLESLGGAGGGVVPDPLDDDSRDSSFSSHSLPESSRIRCENCGQKIRTELFVDHVRQCVKNLHSPRLTRSSSRSPIDYKDYLNGQFHLKNEPTDLSDVKSPTKTPKSTSTATRSYGEERFKYYQDFGCHVEDRDKKMAKNRKKVDSESDLGDGSARDYCTVNSSTELLNPLDDSQSTDGASALKAMESFIERSFAHKSVRKSVQSTSLFASSLFGRNFFSQQPQVAPLPADGKHTSSSSNNSSAVSPFGRQEASPSPQKNTSHLYQNKYLPPFYETSVHGTDPGPPNPTHSVTPPTKPEPASSASPAPDDGADRGVADNNDNTVIRPTSSPTSRKRARDGVSADGEPPDKAPSVKKNLKESYLHPDPTSDDLLEDAGTPERSANSALQSLQGLVYGKSFNTEHPLDSLQKLIHTANTTSSSQTVSTSQAVLSPSLITCCSNSGLPTTLPGTVILVNPIVTVIANSKSSSPSLQISMPPGTPGSPPDGDSELHSPHAADDKGSSSPPAPPDGDTDQTSAEYRCAACNRNFASKGSYRYHLSRCHWSTVKKYRIKEAINTSPYIYLPLDHTAKFNKYYEMANELANKGK